MYVYLNHVPSRDSFESKALPFQSPQPPWLPWKSLQQGGQKKKQILKFILDCTHPVEDGIMDAANFEQFLWKILKRNRKAGNLVEQL